MLLFTMLALATPAQATFPGKNGKIAFTRIQEHENGEIWTINPDGTGLTKLTDATGFENDFGGDVGPQWSPDGNQILFGRSSGLPGQDGLLVMDADGSNQTRIATAAGFNGTPWSPDGRIAVSECAEDCDIYLINPDGSGKTLFAPDASNPAWSRDGTKLAFVTCCYPNETISVMNADGSGRRVLTEGFGPRWGPDDVIAFGRRDGPPHYDGEVFTIKADGTAETRITDNIEFDMHHGWSPGGTRLMYRFIANVFNPGHSRLITVNADGSDPFLVATDLYGGVWSPDGTKLVFEEGGLGVMNIDGTGRSMVTFPDLSIESHDVSPAWQAIPPPARADFKNAAQFCKAEREYWGDAEFRHRYGGGANAHGKCVSAGR
jgi:TolB protein